MEDAANGYIADGYTESGYIREMRGIHQSVRFRYRPVTHEERVRIFEDWTELSAAEQVKRTSTTLSKKILSWDLQCDGKTVDCRDPASYRFLKTPLHNRLLDVVCGTTATDVDPEEPDEPETTRPWGDFLESTDEGNSRGESPL